MVGRRVSRDLGSLYGRLTRQKGSLMPSELHRTMAYVHAPRPERPWLLFSNTSFTSLKLLTREISHAMGHPTPRLPPIR